METITIKVQDYEAVSDGYHTIGELYRHRIALYIALCKQIVHHPYCDDKKFGVWRSQRHFDGSNYDGWFVLGIGREKGHQITYHIPNELWEETNFAETFEKAPMEWDGHTSEDVLERISKL